MRVLFTCAAGYGHLHPKMPLAGALAHAGHDVAFAIPERFCPRVRDAGFTAFPAGPDGPALADQVRRRFPEGADLAPEERLRFAFTNIIRIAVPAVLTDLVPLIKAWAPDLLIHDPSDWAAPVAAHATGTVYVNQSWGPLLPRADLDLAAAAVAPIWEAWGLPAQELGGMFEHLYLDLCPPSFQAPHAADLGVARQLLRPVPFDAVGDERLPPWADGLPDLPTVYVTLGTWFNLETGVFATVLEGLRDEPVNVVVTVGHANDPASFGPQPGNVHLERYIPVSLLLPHCDVVVGHGGAGSTLAALSHGLPLLVLPRGADQFHIAERCMACGVGRCLPPPDLHPDAVRRDVRALLLEPQFRRAAGALRDEIAAMPSPSEVVPALERLTGKARRSR